MHRSIAHINLTAFHQQSTEDLSPISSCEQIITLRELRRSRSRPFPHLVSKHQATQKFLDTCRHFSSIHLTASTRADDFATAAVEQRQQLRRACSRPAVCYSCCRQTYRDIAHRLTDTCIIAPNTTCEVKLTRKGGTTMLTMSSSLSLSLPPIEVSSTDSLTTTTTTQQQQVRANASKLVLNAAGIFNNNDITSKPSRENLIKGLGNMTYEIGSKTGDEGRIMGDVSRVESLPKATNSLVNVTTNGPTSLSPRVASRPLTPDGIMRETYENAHDRLNLSSSLRRERQQYLADLPGDDLAVGEHSSSSRSMLKPKSCPLASNGSPEGGGMAGVTDSEISVIHRSPSMLLKAQVDNILSVRSEKQTISSNHMATDFSRALLQNLLHRSHDSGLDIEASPSYLDVANAAACENRVTAPNNNAGATPSSVTQLAAKIVQRINEVKEGQQQSHAQKVKGIFDKLIETSPSLSSRVSRIRDLYVNRQQMSAASAGSSVSKDGAETDLIPSESFPKLELLEKELDQEETLLAQMVTDLEAFKEKQKRISTQLSAEAEALSELNKIREILSCDIDKSVEEEAASARSNESDK